MKSFILCSALVIIFLLSGCSEQEKNTEAEMPKVKEVVDSFTKTLETEDMVLFEKTFAQDEDMVSFGTDAAERWVGYATLKEAVQNQFDSFENTKMTVRDQVIEIHGSGEVAWFSEIADWDVTAMGEEVKIKNSRITGVLEKRGNDWVIVQFHASVPVSGQAAQY
jgi:ketosteroid isomerase-like protein